MAANGLSRSCVAGSHQPTHVDAAWVTCETLGPVIADLEKLTGVEVRRIYVDKGYRRHNHPHRFRVGCTAEKPCRCCPFPGSAFSRLAIARWDEGSRNKSGIQRDEGCEHAFKIN